MKTTLNRVIIDEPIYDFNIKLSAFECDVLKLVLNSMSNRTQLIARTKWYNHINRNSPPTQCNILHLQNGESEFNSQYHNTLCIIRNVVTKSEIDNVLHFLNTFNTALDIKQLIGCNDLPAVTLSDIVYCVFSFKSQLHIIKENT